MEFHPANATNRQVKWHSDNRSIATVDKSGLVTAKRPGNVIISVKTKDGGHRAEFNLEITAAKGFLTKSRLDALGIGGINKLMIVAHPDDETLWGGSHLLRDQYLVVCMTNGWNRVRKQEFITALGKSGDTGLILEYPDLIHGKKDEWNSVKEGVRQDLALLLSYKPWEEIVTHNPQGEYGHIHHRLTNQEVTRECRKQGLEKKLVYFGTYYTKSVLEDLLKNPDSELAKSPLANLAPIDNLPQKQDMVDGYVSQRKGAIRGFGHMIPYENWKTYQDWEPYNK